MSKIVELHDDDLDQVSGGKITYTWDGSTGTIGMNGYNPFVLVNKDAFVAYYNSVEGTKSDADILNDLLANGTIAYK